MQKRAPKAPSGHMSRLKPAEIDPLSEYGLPSKGDKRLQSTRTQETYYAKIAERYLAFCTSAGDKDELLRQFALLATSVASVAPTPPPTPTTIKTTTSTITSTSATTTATKQDPNLSHILAALRKLREGIVSSKRRDAFAVQVYLFAIRLGVLTSSHETYHPALLYLLRVIHPSHSLTSVELSEVVGYLVLDAACRRGDLAEAFALRNRYKLRDKKIDGVLRALVRDDWVLWRRTRRMMDLYGATLMRAAEADIRGHVLRAFGRAYLSVGLDFLEAQSMAGWEELREEYGVGWEMNGGRVVIRKIHGRS
ncbi:hypothetical protein QBC47DRAFT_315278 [Echria macrotheca]|uniref:CSN8/PSMD8/EIF3K domain-containing protein n=1 Tax=Echria macrotheca TaxID=438768 RepID=A0AAJ0BL91_9PEZI|nr:hypothetical protein QBC47DRAFT_315278 [Echria macrotheca]